MDGTTNRRRQVSSKRRAMIEPEAFKTLHDGAIDLCYDADSWKSGDVETIKGAVCVAIDSYAIAFPNLPERREQARRAAGGLDGHRAWLDSAVGFYAEGYIQALCLEGAARRDRAMTLLESEMEKEVGRRFSR